MLKYYINLAMSFKELMIAVNVLTFAALKHSTHPLFFEDFFKH